MKLETLELFLSVVDAGSFAAAARMLHLSQPAISMTIAALEEEVGQTFLLRSSGHRAPMEMTQAGALFADYSRKALHDWREIRFSLLRQQGAVQPFTLGTSPSTGAVVLPSLVNHFKNCFPDFPIQAKTFPGSSVHNKLALQECAIAITSTLPTDNNFICARFFFDPIVLIAPKSFALKQPISLLKLRKLPLVMREEDCNVTRLLRKALEQHGIAINELNIVMQVFGNAAVRQSVSLEAGAGFVTQSLLADPFASGINYELVNVKNFKIERYLYLARRKNSFTPSMKIFWDFALGTSWRYGVFPYNTLI